MQVNNFVNKRKFFLISEILLKFGRKILLINIFFWVQERPEPPLHKPLAWNYMKLVSLFLFFLSFFVFSLVLSLVLLFQNWL